MERWRGDVQSLVGPGKDSGRYSTCSGSPPVEVYKGELGLYISLLHGLICCNLLSILSAARNKISDQKGLRQVPFLPNKKPRDRHFQDWFSCLAMSRLWVSIFEILGLFPHGHKTAAAVPGIICLPHGKEKKKDKQKSLFGN